MEESEISFDSENDGADDASDTAGLLQKVSALKAELKQTRLERKEYLDGWQRAKADYLNSKKRFEEDRDDIARRAEMRFIEKLLPLIDSFSLALSHSEETTSSDDVWKKGLLQINGQLQALLRDLHLSEVDAENKPFNPHLHEALSSMQVEADKRDIVLTVIQKGYMYKDTLLRPAKVIIGTE